MQSKNRKTSECQCKDGLKKDVNGYCNLKKKLIGSQCNNDAECSQDIDNSLCYENQCTCKLFYSQSKYSSTQCLKFNCKNDLDCKFANKSHPNANCDYRTTGHYHNRWKWCACNNGWLDNWDQTQCVFNQSSNYIIWIVIITVMFLFGVVYVTKKILCC